MNKNDLRLIEAGFPCHQVGAETQRERDTGKAPPPNRLHVWWARRPFTPSRAAILASLLPADTDPARGPCEARQLHVARQNCEATRHPKIRPLALRNPFRHERLVAFPGLGERAAKKLSTSSVSCQGGSPFLPWAGYGLPTT